MKKPSITCELVFITKAIAEKLLEGNTCNRQKRRWWIEAMASAMKRGEWITTHQGIAITKSGRLLDGQHRLEAIVLNGDGVWMLVTRGIDENAFKVIDNGIKRSIADLTNLPKRLSECCRYIASIVLSSNNVSTQQVIDIAACGVADIHEELMETCGTAKKFYSSTPMRTAAILNVMNGHNKSEVFKIYKNLVHENFNEMPMSSQALVRQVTAGKASANDSSDTLARGFKVLNPENANLLKVQCSEPDWMAAREYTRSIIKKSLASK